MAAQLKDITMVNVWQSGSGYDLTVVLASLAVTWTDMYSFTTCWSKVQEISRGFTYVSFGHVGSLLMK